MKITSHIAGPVFKIKSFEYQGVSLMDSFLKRQYEATRNLYLGIANDDLLKGFRERVVPAGHAVPGNDLGGWYSGTYAHIFGRILSAYARMYRATDDRPVKDKADELLEEWCACIDEHGYGFYRRPEAYPSLMEIQFQGEFNYLLFGLLDMLEYGESETALRGADRITGWARKNLSRDLYQQEGYKLSQVLYRAYLLTGDAAYRDLARHYHYDDFWSRFVGMDMWDALEAGRAALLGKHVFSHVDSFNAAIMTYAATGEERYLRACVNAAALIRNGHTYATGLFGPHEHFVLDLRRSLEYDEWGNAEVSCTTWAMNTLLKYLLCITGESRYGDWIEQLVYNGIGAQLLPTSNGDIMYYARYFIGGAEKDYNGPGPFPNGIEHRWTCCNGTYPMNVAEYHNLIYFHDEHCLYVNLFVPSRVVWRTGDATVWIEQETDYPFEGSVAIRVATDRAARFQLRIRVPAWVPGAVSIAVNGTDAGIAARPGRWAVLDRLWNNEDRVALLMQLPLYFEAVSPAHPDLCALRYGSLTLIADRGGALRGDQAHPASWIVRTDGHPLEFVAEGQWLARRFKPYLQANRGEKYFMYHYVEKKIGMYL